MSDNNASQGSLGRPQPAIHAELCIYDIFVNLEGLRLRVPRPLFGFIPFSVSKNFGIYVVMILAAPAHSESTLLLGLAKAALAQEFASISRNSPDEWRIQQIDRRETGAAAPTIKQAECINQDWGALWYELGDNAAKSARYELAKTRLWQEGFQVSRSS